VSSRILKNGDGNRRLGDLVSVGPATLRDLERLEIHSVEELAWQQPDQLYRTLCAVTGMCHDACCEDVFAAGIAQARDPDLPPEKRRWCFWSSVRRQRARNTSR
jgi:hypothetical protein